MRNFTASHLLLGRAHYAHSLLLGPVDREGDLQVDEEEQREGQEVHEEHVEGVHVDPDVGGVLSQPRGHEPEVVAGRLLRICGMRGIWLV